MWCTKSFVIVTSLLFTTHQEIYLLDLMALHCAPCCKSHVLPTSDWGKNVPGTCMKDVYYHKNPGESFEEESISLFHIPTPLPHKKFQMVGELVLISLWSSNVLLKEWLKILDSVGCINHDAPKIIKSVHAGSKNQINIFLWFCQNKQC